MLKEVVGVGEEISVLKEKLVEIWNWDINFDCIFSLKEAYDLISNFEEVDDSSLYKVTWNKLLSSKISLFAWRLFHNRLQTKDNLIQRRMQRLVSPSCVDECNISDTSKHALFDFSISENFSYWNTPLVSYWNITSRTYQRTNVRKFHVWR